MGGDDTKPKPEAPRHVSRWAICRRREWCERDGSTTVGLDCIGVSDGTHREHRMTQADGDEEPQESDDDHRARDGGVRWHVPQPYELQYPHAQARRRKAAAKQDASTMLINDLMKPEPYLSTDGKARG